MLNNKQKDTHFATKPKYHLNIFTDSINNKVKDYYMKLESSHLGDSGIDLYNFKSIQVDFLNVGTIDYEIKCEMINCETNEYVSYYLVPRSSLSKTPFMMANSVGIIDAGYRGNIMAKIRSFDPNNSSLDEGKYFQIVAPDLGPIKVNMVNKLSETSRNDNGFGSTNAVHPFGLFV